MLYCRFIDSHVSAGTCHMCGGSYQVLAERVAKTKKDNQEAFMAHQVGKSLGCSGCGKELRLIVSGFGALITETVLGHKPEPWVLERAKICAECDYRTFLNVVEWTMEKAKAWLSGNNVLPINHTPSRFDQLWCAACSCCIEAVIRAKKKACPINKWAALDDEVT